jgi:hypothetical protein
VICVRGVEGPQIVCVVLQEVGEGPERHCQWRCAHRLFRRSGRLVGVSRRKEARSWK